MELLSITELVEADATTNGETEHESSKTLMNVNVEVVWLALSSTEEVRQCNDSTSSGEGKGEGTTGDIPVVLGVKEAFIEDLWVMLDKFNRSNSVAEISIMFLNVVLVSLNFRSVSLSHFDFGKY